MITPLETATRLLTALEELVMQETLLIRTMDFVEAVDVQERAAPVVEKLCALAADPAVALLRGRVAGLLERYGQNYHFLDSQLNRLQSELDRVTAARSRLRSVAPAYRSGAMTTEPRLNTAA
jgi:hypothetical protein